MKQTDIEQHHTEKVQVQIRSSLKLNPDFDIFAVVPGNPLANLHHDIL